MENMQMHMQKNIDVKNAKEYVKKVNICVKTIK